MNLVPARSARVLRLSTKTRDRRLVLATLYHGRPLSRVELGEVTGLALSALTSLCRELIRDGLIRESQMVSPPGKGRGRRRTLLEVALRSPGVCSINYVRRHLEAAVVDLAGNVQWRDRVERQTRGAPDLIPRLKRTLRAALRASPLPAHRLLAVAAADPGLVNQTTG